VIKLMHGDCLDLMRMIEPGSVDLIATDLPYGTTACKWDSVIPFDPMWKELKRICKPKAAICLFGSQPFTSALVASNIGDFSHEWIWDKQIPSGMSYARFQPMRQHEIISVFGSPAYYPQKSKRDIPIKEGGKKSSESAPIKYFNSLGGKIYDDKFPTTLITFQKIREGALHPTEKPVELLRYLIKTYSQEGEAVLDFTMGSGTTGAACMIENRRFIGIEKDEYYFNLSEARIKRAIGTPCDIPQRLTTDKVLPLFATV
jgi:site-specific DNA-methyltransferase (adenine-specific)